MNKEEYKQKILPNSDRIFCLVTRRGFEPRTHCLKGKALILRAGGNSKTIAALVLFNLVYFACV